MDKQNIAKVLKYGYLKGPLCGAAFTAISGIVFSAVAVILLKQKFGRPDSIIEMLYSKLQHLSKHHRDLMILREHMKILRGFFGNWNQRERMLMARRY